MKSFCTETSPILGLLVNLKQHQWLPLQKQDFLLWIFYDSPPPSQTQEVFGKRERRKNCLLPSLEHPAGSPFRPGHSLIHLWTMCLLFWVAELVPWDPPQLLPWFRAEGQLKQGHPFVLSASPPVWEFYSLCSSVSVMLSGSQPFLCVSVYLFVSICVSLPFSIGLPSLFPSSCLLFSHPVSLPPVHPLHFLFVFLHLPPAPSLALALKIPLSPWHHTSRRAPLGLSPASIQVHGQWGPSCSGAPGVVWPGGRPDCLLSNTLVRLLFI